MEGINGQLLILYVVFILSLTSTFLTCWIVWHVERELDISFKFILLAIIIFTISTIINIFEYYGALPRWGWDKLFKSLFITFFTLGLLEMRSLIISVERKKQNNRKPRR